MAFWALFGDLSKPLIVTMIVIVLRLYCIVIVIVIVVLVCFSALCSAASVSPFQSEGASKEQSLLVN